MKIRNGRPFSSPESTLLSILREISQWKNAATTAVKRVTRAATAIFPPCQARGASEPWVVVTEDVAREGVVVVEVVVGLVVAAVVVLLDRVVVVPAVAAPEVSVVVSAGVSVSVLSSVAVVVAVVGDDEVVALVMGALEVVVPDPDPGLHVFPLGQQPVAVQ